jgi:hypothetical protein
MIGVISIFLLLANVVALRVNFPHRLLAAAAAFQISPEISKQPSFVGVISDSAIARIVADDVRVRQALVTADFTPSIYDPSCKFQDEMDTYNYRDYVKGTKLLFNPQKSHVDLVGDVTATPTLVQFQFKEYLSFNLPFNPVLSLSGRVELTRGTDGKIVYSREFWDQPIAQILSSVKF